MIRQPPISTLSSSSAASDVYKRQYPNHFDQNDEFKKTMFTEENKSAFLNEVIKMMMEIRQAKHLVVQKEEWTEVRKKWMQAGNILYKFIADNMVVGGRTSLMKEELFLSLIHISEPTRLLSISYAVF